LVVSVTTTRINQYKPERRTTGETVVPQRTARGVSKMPITSAWQQEQSRMRLFIALAYNYGWRRGELIGLRTRQVSLVDRTIRLDPGTTKNNKGREVPIPGPDGTAIPECADKQPDV
jgi:site-specific recombinase XerD